MIPGYDSLFNSSEYRQAVDLICPGKPLLDPFQLGIIVQVPGQQVGMSASTLPRRQRRTKNVLSHAAVVSVC